VQLENRTGDPGRLIYTAVSRLSLLLARGSMSDTWRIDDVQERARFADK